MDDERRTAAAESNLLVSSSRVGGLEPKTINQEMQVGLRNLATASPTRGAVEIFLANNANLPGCSTAKEE